MKKRRKIRADMCASTDDYRESICKELRWAEHQERQTQLVPVLVLFGRPRKVLTKAEAKDYESLGCRIEYYVESEIKSLIK